MKAEFYKVRGTEMEEMMKRGNNNEISSMISKKQQALAEALENVEFYKSIGNMEFAANEQNRANKAVNVLFLSNSKNFTL